LWAGLAVSWIFTVRSPDSKVVYVNNVVAFVFGWLDGFAYNSFTARLIDNSKCMQDAGKEDYLRPSERIGLDWIVSKSPCTLNDFIAKSKLRLELYNMIIHSDRLSVYCRVSLY